MERNRQKLINMATGRQSGYWIEEMEPTGDWPAGYVLHRPLTADLIAQLGSEDKAVDFQRGMYYTWEGVRLVAAAFLGKEDAADGLEVKNLGYLAASPPAPLDWTKKAASMINWHRVRGYYDDNKKRR